MNELVSCWVLIDLQFGLSHVRAQKTIAHLHSFFFLLLLEILTCQLKTNFLHTNRNGIATFIGGMENEVYDRV